MQDILLYKSTKTGLFLFGLLRQDPSAAPAASEDIPTTDEAKRDVEEATEACGNHQMFNSEALGPLGGSIERLGLQILEQLPVGPQQPNVLISPFSLSLALAQLALGLPAAFFCYVYTFLLCPVWSMSCPF